MHLSVLLATTNKGKLHELTALFSGLPVTLVALDVVLPNRPPTVEDGITFQDNALIKARAAARDALMVTIAEDAGLEVDALGGRPGVRSARFAKEGATDAENNAELLKQLVEVEDDHRVARFRCTMALVDPWSAEGPPSSRGRGSVGRFGFEIVTEGRCEGMIAREARGAGGFGYDPLFVVDGFGRTMAELQEEEKNRVSHRARAAAALRPALIELVEARVASSARLLST